MVYKYKLFFLVVTRLYDKKIKNVVFSVVSYKKKKTIYMYKYNIWLSFFHAEDITKYRKRILGHSVYVQTVA